MEMNCPEEPEYITECSQESQTDDDLKIPHLKTFILWKQESPQMAELKGMTNQGTCLFSENFHGFIQDRIKCFPE